METTTIVYMDAHPTNPGRPVPAGLGGNAVFARVRLYRAPKKGKGHREVTMGIVEKKMETTIV